MNYMAIMQIIFIELPGEIIGFDMKNTSLLGNHNIRVYPFFIINHLGEGNPHTLHDL